MKLLVPGHVVEDDGHRAEEDGLVRQVAVQRLSPLAWQSVKVANNLFNKKK